MKRRYGKVKSNLAPEHRIVRWANRMRAYGSAYQYVIRRIFGGYEMPRAVLDGTITNCMGNPIKQPK